MTSLSGASRRADPQSAASLWLAHRVLWMLAASPLDAEAPGELEEEAPLEAEWEGELLVSY